MTASRRIKHSYTFPSFFPLWEKIIFNYCNILQTRFAERPHTRSKVLIPEHIYYFKTRKLKKKKKKKTFVKRKSFFYFYAILIPEHIYYFKTRKLKRKKKKKTFVKRKSFFYFYAMKKKRDGNNYFSCSFKFAAGHCENRTRDLSHPKRESYH